MENKNVMNRAADKLTAELEEIKKIRPKDARDYDNVKLTVLGPPVCEMLIRFVVVIILLISSISTILIWRLSNRVDELEEKNENFEKNFQKV